MSGLELSELQSKYELGSKILQKECSDAHLVKIANFFLSWELVAPYLGVNADEVKSTSTQPPLQRRTCLQMWKEIYGFKATYGSLLLVLLESKLGKTACEICKLLQQGN